MKKKKEKIINLIFKKLINNKLKNIRVKETEVEDLVNNLINEN